jgi:hypothetical protein
MRHGILPGMRLPALALVLACGVAAGACLVEVDESLVDRPRDGGVDATTGGDGGKDAGVDAGPYPGLACGTSHCTRTGQVCCATTFGDPDIANGTCTTKDLCESGDYFGCTSARDCRESGLGDVTCCAAIVKGAFNLTRCASTCTAPDVVLCEQATPRCPGAQECLPSTRFPSLFECMAPP